MFSRLYEEYNKLIYIKIPEDPSKITIQSETSEMR